MYREGGRRGESELLRHGERERVTANIWILGFYLSLVLGSEYRPSRLGRRTTLLTDGIDLADYKGMLAPKYSSLNKFKILLRLACSLE